MSYFRLLLVETPGYEVRSLIESSERLGYSSRFTSRNVLEFQRSLHISKAIPMEKIMSAESSVTVEGKVSPKEGALAMGGVLVLGQLINNSPELKSAFSALDASQVNALAQKLLASDDVARLVNQVASTPEVLNAAENLPAGIDFDGLKSLLPADVDFSELKPLFKLGKILPEDFEISETIEGATEAVGEAVSGVTEAGSEVLSAVAETGGEILNTVAEAGNGILSIIAEILSSL